MNDKLVYKAPPRAEPEKAVRRVYALPANLVERIHKYGYDYGHQSEVSAVRELLEAGLSIGEESL